MKPATLLLLATLVLPSGLRAQGGNVAPAAPADSFPYHLLNIPDPQTPPSAEVIEITRDSTGTSLVFTGRDDRDYMVWHSLDVDFWGYATMAGRIAPGLYSAHVPRDVVYKRAFYVIMEVQDGQLFNPQQVREDLLSTVAFLDELTPSQRASLETATETLAAALAVKAQSEATLAAKRRQLADCQTIVAQLRQEALAANEALAAAHAALASAEQEVDRLAQAISDAEADLAAKRANLAEWEAWAPGEIAGLQAQMAAATSDIERNNIQGRINLINNALQRRRDLVAEAEARLAQLHAELAAAQNARQSAAAATPAAAAAAQAAQEAYERNKDNCRPCEDAVAAAEEAARQAAAAADEAAGEFDTARQNADAQADDNIRERERQEAAEQATVSAEEAARRAAEEAEARAKLEKQLAEWKKFFDAIRESAGDEEAKRVAEEIKGQLGRGIDVLTLLGGALEALARGGSVADAIAGMGAGGLQVGYGALVAYAQSVAVNAVVAIASGAIARMLKEMSDLKPGESRYHNLGGPGGSSGHAMVIRNANGTYTVWTWTKNYFTSGGTMRQHVLAH